MDSTGFRESQYDYMLQIAEETGRPRFGLVAGAVWANDPRRLTFLLSRYKFVAKMFEGMDSALEVGCGDGTGTILVRQVVPNVVATDFDEVFIQDARDRAMTPWPIDFRVHDFLEGSFPGDFDCAFALDVLEHIAPHQEHLFLQNVRQSLGRGGVAIFGMPSLESQNYASPASREGHVNCKSGRDLVDTMKEHFDHTFLFSMNDEVVHTGFAPMAHYLLVLCVGAKP